MIVADDEHIWGIGSNHFLFVFFVLAAAREEEVARSHRHEDEHEELKECDAGYVVHAR